MLLALLAGCGVAALLPEGPVLDAGARAATFGAPRGSGAAYGVTPADVRAGPPIPPVLVWGAAYDLDLVVVDHHPDWDMHEIARLDTPEGPVWLAKDARASTLEQTVVVDLADVDAWMPELPVARRAGPVAVTDRSTAEQLDLDVAYVNVDGEPVRIHYDGPRPTAERPKRNGSTMGHSRGSLMAVLDLSRMAPARHATVEIDGERQRIFRLLGLVPFRMALVQAQGGLATGRFLVGPDGAADVTRHLRGEAVADAHWTWSETDGGATSRQVRPERELVYAWVRSGEALELAAAEVVQPGRSDAVTRVTFAPAIPDLRRRFSGRPSGRFVVDVNGQANHAVGAWAAWWDADGPHVAITPEAPWWVADRPMETRVSWTEGAADVSIVRTPSSARTGRGARGRARPD